VLSAAFHHWNQDSQAILTGITFLKPAQPVSDILDRIAAPVGLLCTFGALLALLCVAYSSDLEQALSRMPGAHEGRTLPGPVRTALRTFEESSPGRAGLAVRMADIVARRALVGRDGPGAVIRLRAYRELLLAGKHRSLMTETFLAIADFGVLDKAPAPGIRTAALATFGLGVDSLSLGESLILLHQALADRSRGYLSDRADVIALRNQLLLKAFRLGVIDSTHRADEIRQPLSWAIDHRPVW
jgi:hypothetical protein